MSTSGDAAPGARILVVDDEPIILRTVRANLRGHGFRVETAESGRDALSTIERFRPDVLLLDLGLPDVDGLQVIQALREQVGPPIIVLSARGDERDKVRALDLGADDYLTKPFGVDELLARVRVALRHAARVTQGTEAFITVGALRLDLERRRVLVGNQDVHLTPTEYGMLLALAQHPDRVLTDRMLLQRVWGVSYGEEAHYLHVYAARLRKKLGAAAHHLVTEPGVGYRLVTTAPPTL